MNTNINELTDKVIGAAIEVHKTLGPGLNESTYQRALGHEMSLRGIGYDEKKICQVTYKDITLEEAFTVDFVVEDTLIVEIKATDNFSTSHESEVQTFLRLTGRKVGLLFNFNATRLTQGLRRIVLREKEAKLS